MINNVYRGGLYTGNLDPVLYAEFRECFYGKKGTLNGVNKLELVSAVKELIRVREGELEIVECVDPDSVLLLTHMKNSVNNRIMRKNQKTQLNRISIDCIDKKDCNMIKQFLIKTYGTIYGKMSPLINEAMKLHLDISKGFVKLVKTDKKSDKSFIMDDKGQITSYNIDSLFEVVKEFKTMFGNMDEFIERKVKSTIQSTLNIVPKAKGRIKKAVKGTVRSFKHENKRDKALGLLEGVMKFRKFGFTDKDFGRTSVKLTGQGDPRTHHTDLDLLEGDNRIKKVRNSAHGIRAYQFVENNQYHKYNSELACEKFIEGFKEAFVDIDACTLDELNDFIFERDGLFDAQSQHKRLKWLLSDGCVKRHDVNPRLLFIQK